MTPLDFRGFVQDSSYQSINLPLTSSILRIQIRTKSGFLVINIYIVITNLMLFLAFLSMLYAIFLIPRNYRNTLQMKQQERNDGGDDAWMMMLIQYCNDPLSSDVLRKRCILNSLLKAVLVFGTEMLRTKLFEI